MHKNLQRFIFLVIVSLMCISSYSQSVSVNTTGAPATGSAILDVSSTDKGVLVPRMSKAQKNAIITPATGLLVFQETPDSIGFHFYSGTRWMWIDTASGKTGWLTTGNAGTDTAVHFIGTLDDKPLMFRQNNLWMGQLNTRKRSYFLGAASGFYNTGTQNAGYGDSSLFNNTTGTGNTAMGYRSMIGSGPITGGANVAMGNNSLSSITTGGQNIAIGDNAMTSMRTGGINVILGPGAMESATGGISNIAMGLWALRGNDSGSYNIAIGTRSLYQNDSLRNTAIGYEALFYNNRHNNLAIGFQSGYYNNYLQSNPLWGIENTYVGFGSGVYPNTGGQNTALGYRALQGSGYFNGDDPGNLYYKRNVAIGDSSMTLSYGNDNVAIGFKTLTKSAHTSLHTAVGSRALSATTATYPNTAVGYSSQDSATTGWANTTMGSYALMSNKDGYNNTAIGNAAMMEAYNAVGNFVIDNTAIGNDALRKARYYGHVAVGAGALRNDTSGIYNTAVGVVSMHENRNGFYNTAVGTSSLRSMRSGIGNVSVGTNNMYNHKSGDFNTSIGYESMINDTSGFVNTAVGWRSLRNNISGSENTAIGVGALEFTDSSSRNTAVGRGAMIGVVGSKGVSENVAIGFYAGAISDSAKRTVLLGAYSGYNNQAYENVFVGWNSGFGGSGSPVTGIENTGLGTYTLYFNNTGKSNTALGMGALFGNRTGNGNVGIGTRALANAQSYSYNIAIGDSAMYGNNADGNVAIGTKSMWFNNTGSYNTATGNFALRNNNSGHRNVAVGDSALYTNTTGSLNTGIGYYALTSGTLTNSTAIGANASVVQSNSMVLGSINGINGATSDTKVGIGTTTPDSTFSVADRFMVNNAGSVQYDNSVPVMNYMFRSGSLNSDRMVIAHSPGVPNWGLQYQDNGDKFHFLTGGTPVITADLLFGRLGINAVSPQARLHVVRNGLSGGSYLGNLSAIFEDNAQSYIQLLNPNNAEGGILSGNVSTPIRSGVVFGVDSSVQIRAGGNNTRLTAADNGFIGIGTTGPVVKLHVYENTGVHVNTRIASVNSSFEPGLELVKNGGGSDWKIRTAGVSGTLIFSRGTDDFVTAPTDEYEMSTSSFRPFTDGSNTLGTASNRWSTVYSTVGAINTSDARDKENISNLNYGLKEIMKLRPVSFNWKGNPQWGKKIGFIAQEIQPVISEVVQVGELDNNEHAKDDNGKINKSDKLGIYYSDIIPVAVKAIQEQQQQIEKLSEENKELLKKNEALEKDIKLIKEKLGIKN